MKRLLVFLIALSIGLSAKAAYEYDATISGKVTVTDLSFKSGGKMIYNYQLEYAQVGTNSSGSTFESSAVLIIYPDGPSIAGTFTLDGTVDSDSYVKYGSAYRYVVDYTGKPTSITITDNGDDTYTISGAFRTKNGSNYYYYYYDPTDPANTFEYIPPKPYDDEPEAGSFTFNASGAAVSITDYVAAEGLITVDVNDKNYNFVELAIVADEFALPAGTYSVSDSGVKGTIVKASGEKGGYYPEGSYLNYNYENYYVTGGSVTVSYSDDASTITISGTVTSAHGSTIAISATTDNPFKSYEPKTYALTVSKIVATVHPKDTYDNKDYVILDVTAKNGDAACNGRIRVNSAVLEGSYNYQNFNGTYTYFGYDASGWSLNYIYGQDTENAMTIEKTGNANEYKLSCRISCGGEKDYVIYTITDAIFTWVAPTPFDAEPDNASTINAEYACQAEVTRDAKAGTTTVFVENAEFSPLAIVFAGTGDLLPCRYTVCDNLVPGGIVASAGRKGTGWDMVETGTWYGKGISMYDYTPYYITGGYIDVNYVGNNVELVGVLTSKKGSTINVHAVCPNFNSISLPANFMSGYISGTGSGYFFTWDIITSAESGEVTLYSTLVATGAASGLKPAAKVDGETFESSSCDSETGECAPIELGSFDKGSVIKIDILIETDGGTTEGKTINYTVE